MRPGLLVIVLLIPIAAAEPLLSDPSSDVALVPNGGAGALPGLPAPAATAGASDLVSLEVGETEDALLLAASLSAIPSQPTTSTITTNFVWNAVEYSVLTTLFLGQPGEEARTTAYLQRMAGETWDLIARLDDPRLDLAAAAITIQVPKVYVLDGMQRAPSRGDSIHFTQVVADTRTFSAGDSSLAAHDAMPDAPGDHAYVLTLGDFSEGDIEISAPDRVRVSNGGATTFVFRATLQNAGPADEEYALAIPDLPESWTSRFQTPVKVPAGQQRGIAILVSVPFKHVHGGFSAFNLTALSTHDPASQARMRMGVLHTPIPQPAGHHPELFLHARDPRGSAEADTIAAAVPIGRGWMNTVAEHDHDITSVTPILMNGALEWRIPLNPRLAIGLDLDLNLTGSIEGSLIGHRSEDVDLDARLVVGNGKGDEIIVAQGQDVTLTLDQRSATPFNMTLVPTPEGDYLPYEAGRIFALVLTMPPSLQESVKELPPRPELLVDGFRLGMPFLEYHDKLTGVAEAAESIEIVAGGAVEKAGLPGTLLTYTFTVRNTGPADTFVFEVAGNDAARATLVPAGEVALDEGATRTATIAVGIPTDANAGQEFEVLLFVHGRDDAGKLAVARTLTRATFDAQEAVPDEAGALDAAQDRESRTPAPGIAVAVVVAMAAALLRRRR